MPLTVTGQRDGSEIIAIAQSVLIRILCRGVLIVLLFVRSRFLTLTLSNKW